MNTASPVLPDDFERRLLVACGYLELAMPDEAVVELAAIALGKWLEEVPGRSLRLNAVLLGYYQQTGAWEQMETVALQLYWKEPARVQWAISLAFATRRRGNRPAARRILRRAEREFPREGGVKYNLADHAREGGELDLAREYLRRAFALEPRLRALARADADFRPLWGELAEL